MCQPAMAASSSFDCDRTVRKCRNRAVSFRHSSVISVSKNRVQPADRNCLTAFSKSPAVTSSC